MSKLLGVAPIFEKIQAQAVADSAEARHKANRAEFAQKVKSGNVAAYGMMGQETMNTFRHLPIAERQALACPYWQECAPAHQAKYNAFRVSRSEQNRDKAYAKNLALQTSSSSN